MKTTEGKLDCKNRRYPFLREPFVGTRPRRWYSLKLVHVSCNWYSSEAADKRNNAGEREKEGLVAMNTLRVRCTEGRQGRVQVAEAVVSLHALKCSGVLVGDERLRDNSLGQHVSNSRNTNHPPSRGLTFLPVLKQRDSAVVSHLQKKEKK